MLPSLAMLMPANFSLNAVLILILGAMFFFGGVYFAVFMALRLMAFGMFATAVGCVCCGLTDGFTDATPRGSLLKRLGAAAFIIGIPILIYTGYQFA
jgi:hypothetical protein